MTRLNAKGVQQVTSFIARNHKLGEIASYELIRAQVLSVNRLISEGKEPTAQIEYNESTTGCEVQYTVTPEGITEGFEQ